MCMFSVPRGPEICTWAAYHTPNYGKKSHLNSDSKSQRCFKWADGRPRFTWSQHQGKAESRKATAGLWVPEAASSSVRESTEKQAGSWPQALCQGTARQHRRGAFSTGTIVRIGTKKELAGGTDGFRVREAHQDISSTCQPHGTDRKESSQKPGQRWSRWSQVRNLQL